MSLPPVRDFVAVPLGSLLTMAGQPSRLGRAPERRYSGCFSYVWACALRRRGCSFVGGGGPEGCWTPGSKRVCRSC